MSRPGTGLSPEAGWYRDPAGRDGDARWWDGGAWTDAHVPRESADAIADPAELPGSTPAAVTEVYLPPSATVWSPGAAAPTAAAPLPPTRTTGIDLVDDAGDPAPEARRGRVWWLVGGVVAFAVVLVLLVTTGVFSPSTEEEAGPNLGPSAGASASGGVRPVRIVDSAAGISYKFLGIGWREFDLTPQKEMSSTAGEYIVTQEQIPGGGEFIAQVTSGPLNDGFGAADETTWPTLITQVKESVRTSYYPQPNTTTDFRNEAVDIDNHKAWVLGFDLKWDAAGYDSTGERAVLLLIDAGKARPALMYLSFPNTHAELYPLIDDVIASVTVDP